MLRQHWMGDKGLGYAAPHSVPKPCPTSHGQPWNGPEPLEEVPLTTAMRRGGVGLTGGGQYPSAPGQDSPPPPTHQTGHGGCWAWVRLSHRMCGAQAPTPVGRKTEAEKGGLSWQLELGAPNTPGESWAEGGRQTQEARGLPTVSGHRRRPPPCPGKGDRHVPARHLGSWKGAESCWGGSCSLPLPRTWTWTPGRTRSLSPAVTGPPLPAVPLAHVPSWAPSDQPPHAAH